VGGPSEDPRAGPCSSVAKPCPAVSKPEFARKSRVSRSVTPTILSRSGAGWHSDAAATSRRPVVQSRPRAPAGVSRPGASRIPGRRHPSREVVQAPTQPPNSRPVRDARVHRRGVTSSAVDAWASRSSSRPPSKAAVPEETLGVDQRGARGVPVLERHARKHWCETLGALRHQGMRQWRMTSQGSPETGRTGRSHAHRGDGRRVCILVSRQCVEIVRQSSEMSDGSGGVAWPGSWASGGRSMGMDPLALSVRPGYGPVRRRRGAFRPQVRCCLGFAGHRGVRADQ
jgi:hypothetical protein